MVELISDFGRKGGDLASTEFHVGIVLVFQKSSTKSPGKFYEVRVSIDRRLIVIGFLLSLVL
jgi:hypothetical protein